MINTFFNFLKKKKILLNYKNINKKLFHKKFNTNDIILVEFNAFHSDHLFFSYFSNVLSKKYNAKIIAFYNFKLIVSKLKDNWISKLKWFFSNFLNYNNFGIYRSFGVESFIKPNIDKNIENASSKIYNRLIKKIKKKEDVYKIYVNKAFLGDLIYDSYLKYHYEPTIDITSEKFKIFLFEFICLHQYWEKFFKNNSIKAVLGVHAHYSYGIVFRVAFKFKIPVYVHNEGKVFYLNNKNKYQFSEYRLFEKIYASFSKKEKKECLKIGETLIKKRIRGEKRGHIGSTYISKSSFNKSDKLVLKKSKKIKILICTQDFFDAINVYGSFHFVDFVEWLNFLGKLSNITNYDWYIKDHPNYLGKYKKYQPFTTNITKKIIKKYKNLNYLKPNTKHNEIIKSGIDYVITIFGSVSFEYPYFDIPVITSTRNIPGINYNFNLHTRNKLEMKKLILSLKKKKYKFDKNKLRRFYFFYFYYFNNSTFYNKYNDFNITTKNWDKYWSVEFYEFWIKNFNNDSHKLMLKKSLNFINSKQYCMNEKNVE